MHKTDLVKQIASDTGLSQKDATAALESFLATTTKALKKGDTITLIGFGTFKITQTAARKGRNPQTGKEIQIPASRRVRFTAGKSLKEEVN